MADLPAWYIDNIKVFKSRTTSVRGNVVSNCCGSSVEGIYVHDCDTVRVKGNKVSKMRSMYGNSTGIKIENCNDVLLTYHVSSRCKTGLVLINNGVLDIYNVTAHNCSIDFNIDNPGSVVVIRNIALSSYKGSDTYKNNIGFVVGAGSSVDVDYIYYFGMRDLYSGGTVAEGSHITESKILYLDEENDDLTPDHISVLVNAGTPNPVNANNSDIGGIESEITDEETADRKFHYSMLDNTFWNIDDADAVEVSLIQAMQSRIMANTEVALTSAKKDYYIKQMNSSTGFSQMFPQYSYYFNQSKFKKRVTDLWYATINPSTLQTMQNTIGGYNLFPTFFKRTEDDQSYWLLGSSALGDTSLATTVDVLRFGISLDVLGMSTMSSLASAECYNHFRDYVADTAPFTWTLHDEPQPSGYLLFTDMWNGFEDCQLSNMVYNDDFNISPFETTSCSLITPLLLTGANPIQDAVSTLGPSPSGGGYVELSLLDRYYSENIERSVYFRQGDTSVDMSEWSELNTVISSSIYLDKRYVQFKVEVNNLPRVTDYEFMGLCLRGYTSKRVWTVPVIDGGYLQLRAGDAVIGTPPLAHENSLGIGLPKSAIGDPSIAFHQYIPESWRKYTSTFRFIFSASNPAIGDVRFDIIYATVDTLGNISIPVTNNYTVTTPGFFDLFYVDLDIPELNDQSVVQLYLSVVRRSTDAADTYVGTLDFLNAHTV